MLSIWNLLGKKGKFCERPLNVSCIYEYENLLVSDESHNYPTSMVMS